MRKIMTIKSLDIKALTEWLKTLNKDDFDRGVDDNLISGTHEEDLKNFHEDDKKHIKASEIIFGEEPFLVDLYDGNLCVVTYTKRKVKAQHGRIVNMKLEETLLNMPSVYGVNRNGYWKIPKRFFGRKQC